jgi:hypothetical protein
VDAKAAKQFLISKVIEQAELEQVSLSEVEKGMLRFTESDPSLRDIYEINAEFERDYDADQYESKIAGLLKNARLRDQDQSPTREQEWSNALAALRKEDHYILVMTAQAFGRNTSSSQLQVFLKYAAIGIGIVLILVLLSIWRAGH